MNVNEQKQFSFSTRLPTISSQELSGWVLNLPGKQEEFAIIL
jgi:hypothetical protein